MIQGLFRNIEVEVEVTWCCCSTKYYCFDRESNTGPQDLQSCALPTELSKHISQTPHMRIRYIHYTRKLTFNKIIIGPVLGHLEIFRLSQWSNMTRQLMFLLTNIFLGFGTVTDDVDHPSQYFEYNSNCCIIPSQIETMVHVIEFYKKKESQMTKSLPALNWGVCCRECIMMRLALCFIMNSLLKCPRLFSN